MPLSKIVCLQDREKQIKTMSYYFKINILLQYDIIKHEPWLMLLTCKWVIYHPLQEQELCDLLCSETC